jgi:hypothetical protein
VRVRFKGRDPFKAGFAPAIRPVRQAAIRLQPALDAFDEMDVFL